MRTIRHTLQVGGAEEVVEYSSDTPDFETFMEEADGVFLMMGVTREVEEPDTRDRSINSHGTATDEQIERVENAIKNHESPLDDSKPAMINREAFLRP